MLVCCIFPHIFHLTYSLCKCHLQTIYSLAGGPGGRLKILASCKVLFVCLCACGVRMCIRACSLSRLCLMVRIKCCHLLSAVFSFHDTTVSPGLPVTDPRCLSLSKQEDCVCVCVCAYACVAVQEFYIVFFSSGIICSGYIIFSLSPVALVACVTCFSSVHL